MTPQERKIYNSRIDKTSFRSLADEIHELPSINARTGEGELLMLEIDKKIQALFDFIYQATANF